MSDAFTGGCACGAIRYKISAEPIGMNDCQCRQCQQRSGTGHGSYMAFASPKDVELTGKAAHWDVAADSGLVKTHGFCPTCGTPVHLTFAALPEIFIVHAGSLDDPSRYKPQFTTYRIRGHHWDHVDPALPRFDEMPTG
ncbi:GFA family protein [Mesorhizobium sp. IMUNJ 23232]|uniref:GFA family protein n=1 Tax=Mesorhizobium sp. IMUNJ 23232 TaxID=3376064 RepID=UPI0037B86210